MLDIIKDILQRRTSPSLRYCFPLLGVVASLIVAQAWQMIFGSQLQSISIFFIFPFGSIILGFVASYTYYAGRYIYNLPIKKSQYILASLLGICAFTLSFYLDYSLISYNVRTGTVSTNILNKEHDDSYLRNDIAFKQYMNEIVHSDLTLSRRRGGSANISFDWASFIYFIIQLLGSILGGVGAVLLVTRHKKYCEDCHRYYEFKSLFKFPAETSEELIMRLKEKASDTELLNSFIKEQQQMYHVALPYGEVNIGYCSSCFKADYMIHFQKQMKRENLHPTL